MHSITKQSRIYNYCKGSTFEEIMNAVSLKLGALWLSGDLRSFFIRWNYQFPHLDAKPTQQTSGRESRQ